MVINDNLLDARRYGYDEENRLVEVTDANDNLLQEIVYDALGRRIESWDYAATVDACGDWNGDDPVDGRPRDGDRDTARTCLPAAAPRESMAPGAGLFGPPMNPPLKDPNFRDKVKAHCKASLGVGRRMTAQEAEKLCSKALADPNCASCDSFKPR